MKLNFKTISRIACLMLLLLCGNIKHAFASHYGAGDLYAEFIGRDSLDLRYRITLTVYVTCEQGSSTLSNLETIQIRSANANISRTKNFTTVLAKQDTLDQLCPNFSIINKCRNVNSIFPGFTRAYYIDTVVLSSPQTDWRFIWRAGNRNGGINNLVSPNTTFIVVEAGVNNTGNYWSYSTPKYLEDPIPYLCVNQPNSFLNRPKDVDPTDSLFSYRIHPRTDIGPYDTIPYDIASANYNVANPIASTTGYNVNPISAAAFFNPPNTGKFVLAFRTDAYDLNNPTIRTGYCSRDVQVAVLSCNAPPPDIDTIPTNLVPAGEVIPGNIISICPNVRTSFDVSSRSLANSNYILLTSDNITTAPGSNFTTDTAGGITTGHFVWTPTTADIGDHVVTFTTKDTTCNPQQPILLRNYQILTIRVLPGLSAGPDLKICPLGDEPVQLNVSGPPNKIYKWYSGNGGTPLYISNRNIPNPTAKPPVDYTYIVGSDDPVFACKRRDTVVVRIDRSNSVNIAQDPLVVCRPSYNTIGADAVGVGPIQNLPCGTFNPINCTTPAQIQVGITGNTGNFPQNTPFFGNRRYHKYQFIITKSELKNAGLYSGTLRSIAFKSNNPTLLGNMPLGPIKVSLACTDRTNYPNLPVNGSFEVNTTVVATQPSYTITPNGWNTIGFTAPYNWDTTKNLIVDICMGPYTVVDSNNYDPVDMTVGETIQRYSDVVDICSGDAVFSDVVKYTQRPVVRFDYCSAPELPFDYRWSPGTNLSDSTLQYTTAYVPYSMNYAVFTRGKNGCLVSDSLHITVPVYTLSIDPKDTAVCINQEVPMHATGASGYIWYENGFNTPTTLSCNDCANPIAIPTTPGIVTYTVVFLNPDNCLDTLQQVIHVHTPPAVAIVNNDTTIKYGQSVMLMVNGANQYTWTPVGSLTDPNIPNPVATPTQSTTYIVYGIDQNKCRSSDSVRINIDFRDNLLIPTGFTPNADGRNDYFKVVNVTFQKLMEFRVFNRWGQEIFNTTDPARGWDGKWKGVDQDMGTYKYIIRVAFPDGYVETYKGDVTLIR